jgi:hypothetical protein
MPGLICQDCTRGSLAVAFLLDLRLDGFEPRVLFGHIDLLEFALVEDT